VLLIEPHSELLNAWWNLPSQRRSHRLLLLDVKRNLWVALTHKTAIVYVRTPNYHAHVVGDDQLRVNVEDFSQWQLLGSWAVLSQTIELQILSKIVDMRQSPKERFGRSAYSPILPIELNPHYSWLLLPYVSFKPRQQRNEDHNFERLFWWVCLADPLSQFFNDQIFLTDKELILYVNKSLCCRY
jgi:hypothetical protein